MRNLRRFFALGLAISALGGPAVAGDAAFARFLSSMKPEAEAVGVSAETFDRETRGLEPDYGLPDLALPGRPETGAPAQPEFVRPPADYVKEATIAGLANEGRKLLSRHRAALDRIEARFGVPATMVLAIWGRETDYGRSPERYDGLRVVATQAFVGRRKEQYRREFVLALKLLDEGAVSRKAFRASWAGATGLTQFLPSEYYDHGADGDGDGRVDIWGSAPDALASAAKQLADKGWKSGVRWAFEVRAPARVDCTEGVPEVRRPLGAWFDAGFAPLGAAKPGRSERAEPASLLQPEGAHGPAFLTTRNYFVIKDYNFSDLYVLFVGHLSDRIDGGGPFVTSWTASRQLKTASVEAMQRHLTRLGFYRDKIDGKAGMLTRSALGAFQKSAGLTVDCWPSDAALEALSAAK
ncbi:MAG: lytic murein transglycosylase [Hyphomicrobiales bacterium]|nr:lytic murein transglycosylase [Hyphomicrobiales bacterium]